MRCTSFFSETTQGRAASCELFAADVGHPGRLLKEEQVRRAGGRLPIYRTFAFLCSRKEEPSASERSPETMTDA